MCGRLLILSESFIINIYSVFEALVHRCFNKDLQSSYWCKLHGGAGTCVQGDQPGPGKDFLYIKILAELGDSYFIFQTASGVTSRTKIGRLILVHIRDSYLDQPQYPTYPKDPDHPEESGGDRKVRHHVFHHDADNAGDDQHEVEDIPAGGEVLEAEADNLHAAL